MSLTEITLAVTTVAGGLGWAIDRKLQGKRQDLDVLRGIIDEQKRYTDTLQRRVTELQNDFEDKCAEMTNKLDAALVEIKNLKKKLNEL